MIGPLVLGYLGAALLLERRGRALPVAGSRFDAIVVLGCPVAADGGPSPALARRTELAARLFHHGHAGLVVTTGGATRPHHEPEARVAARSLRSLGVPEDALLIEDRSFTTLENARFARRLLPGAERVLVVSDAFHVPRARLLFRRHFPVVAGAGALGSRAARAKGALHELPVALLYTLAS